MTNPPWMLLDSSARSGRFVSVGECMIEMSPIGEGTFLQGIAGDTLNTAWYMRAFLPEGWSVDYVTALGSDHYSADILKFLTRSRIGTSHVRIIHGRRPGLYLIHHDAGDRHFTYWRENSAAKALADDEDFLRQAFSGASLLYFTGITLAILPPVQRTSFLRTVASARAAGTIIAFDPNFRPSLWASREDTVEQLEAAVCLSHVVLPTFADEAALFGDTSATATANRYLALGVDEVIVKDGPNEATFATRTVRFGARPESGLPVSDATGAGDSFNAAYLVARLRGHDPVYGMKFGHQVASEVISTHGALVDVARAFED